MNRLIVGLPLYHWTPASFFANWLKLDQRQMVGTVTVDGAYVTQACDKIVANAFGLDTEWDRLVILEHDMICPPWALTRMACYEPEHAVVGALYFRHEPPHHAQVYIEQGEELLPIAACTAQDLVDEPSLYEVSAVGFGMVSIARHVLETWDPEIPMFQLEPRRLASHDLWFCHHARQQGHKVFVDTSLVCDHLTQSSVGLADNQRCGHMVDPADIQEFSLTG